MIKLGDRVKDKITGFQGVVTGRCEYLNGCIQLCIRPEKLKDDGDRIEAKWIDEYQIKIVKTGVLKSAKEPLGGPRADSPSTTYKR